MSASAYTVPAGEDSVAPPPFNPADLCDERGVFVWAPELVLGVDLENVGTPTFLAEVRSRRRQLQRTTHPDRCLDGEGMSR